MALSKTKRVVLGTLVVSPLVLLPAALAVCRAWLDRHLEKELTLGRVQIRLVKPHLGWALGFRADSLSIASPAFRLRAGRVEAGLRFWKSIAGLRPNLEAHTDSVEIRLPPRGPKQPRPPGEPLVFPRLRIPLPLEIRLGYAALYRDSQAGPLRNGPLRNGPLRSGAGAQGARALGGVRDIRFQSAGSQEAVLETGALTLAAPIMSNPDSALPSSSWDTRLRVAARWSGVRVRYQAQLRVGEDYILARGQRRKSNLRVGHDSLQVGVGDLAAYGRLAGRRLPEVRDLRMELSAAADLQAAYLVKARLRAPPVWLLGPQEVELTGNLEDSLGRVVINTRGDAGEVAYLQGRFQLPADSIFRWPAVRRELTATLSGFTRNFRLPLGDKLLPADMEIRRLKVSPGLALEAEVRTRDNSLLRLEASAQPRWRCVFSGQVGPRESWAHAWTDTNLAYRSARVAGEIRPGEVSVQAWIVGARAYRAVADSLYAVQSVRKDGYYLTSSRLYWKDAVWSVTGGVQWGKAPPSRRVNGRLVSGHRRVSLAFAAQSPQFGKLSYAMPRRKYMVAAAHGAVLDHVPYPPLAGFFVYRPVVTGDFEWDWLFKTGKASAQARLYQAGAELAARAQAQWDAEQLGLSTLELALGESKLRLSGRLLLAGRQFHQVRKLRRRDVLAAALEAEQFDAARVLPLFAKALPLAGGRLDGRLAYSDTGGFQGAYAATDLDIVPARKYLTIPRAALRGEGDRLILSARTLSADYPWLNDSLTLSVTGLLRADSLARPEISLRAFADDGFRLEFDGFSRAFRGMEGSLALRGAVPLPGGAGSIQDARLLASLAIPFRKDLLKIPGLAAGTLSGRYATSGLDTQSFAASFSLGEGALHVPDLRAQDAAGRTLHGELEGRLTGRPAFTGKLRGEAVSLSIPGLQKLTLEGVQATLNFDSLGLAVDAGVTRGLFQSSRPPVKIKGQLENVTMAYLAPRPTQAGLGAPTPQLRLKARMRNFLFQHKMGFREVQRFFRSVKTDKRKKRVKPVDLQIALETVGAENRIETDILRMYFVGDLSLKGIYPYTMLSGEFSSLSGELGQSSQSYDIQDFDLRWQNATLEEGRVTVEGGKKLRSDCRPETQRTCNVYIKLDGRLDEMAFTYDSDCGQNAGEAIEPAALINSVSRGCYSDEYIAGAGGGGYGQAVINFLEPTLNENLSRVGSKVSMGWIKSTQVTGIGAAVSGDTLGAEPLALGVESKEKWGMRLMAKAGYHPEKKVQNPWENRAALEWRPPVEKMAPDSSWKRRVRDRVTLEASVETRPDEKREEEGKQVRKQVGIRYRYKFWKLW